GEVVEVTQEVLRLGEHADGGRASGHVGGRLRDGVAPGRDDTARGACALDLRDDASTAQRRRERRWRWRGGRAVPEPIERLTLAGGIDPAFGRGTRLPQELVHWCVP